MPDVIFSAGVFVCCSMLRCTLYERREGLREKEEELSSSSSPPSTLCLEEEESLSLMYLAYVLTGIKMK